MVEHKNGLGRNVRDRFVLLGTIYYGVAGGIKGPFGDDLSHATREMVGGVRMNERKFRARKRIDAE